MHDLTASAPTRSQIDSFEAALRALPQLDCPPEHTFGPGFYARTIRIPAGATLTGKVHRTEHVFIVSEGEIVLVTEDGRRHVKAPFVVVARPGLKRVGHAITDVVCTNVHVNPTDERDIAKLEAMLVEQDALAMNPPGLLS